MEGFDDMAEALFGKNGFFPSEISKVLFDDIIPRMRSTGFPLNFLADKLEATLRAPTEEGNEDKGKRKKKNRRKNKEKQIGVLLQTFEDGELDSVDPEDTEAEVYIRFHFFL